jgi:hypothetical protein
MYYTKGGFKILNKIKKGREHSPSPLKFYVSV